MKAIKELPIVCIVLLPFLYLAYFWQQLPAQVPIHWNAQGEIDRFGSKATLWLIPILLPLLTYLLLLIVPLLDPKIKAKTMGKKFDMLKTLMSTLMAILAIYIIYSAKNQSLTNPNIVVLFVGVLFLILGNYFKILQSNYFIGIRTPWTLESPSVWKKTHRLGGIIFFIGGLILILSSLILSNPINFILLVVVSGITLFVPIVYSFLLYKKEQNTSAQNESISKSSK